MRIEHIRLTAIEKRATVVDVAGRWAIKRLRQSMPEMEKVEAGNSNATSVAAVTS
jgi:hypothetical protein